MKEVYQNISLLTICKLFGKSRQAWYHIQEHKDQKAIKYELVLEKVRKIRTDMPKIGGIKLHFMLKNFLELHDIDLGRDALFTMLRENNMLIKQKKRYARTTNSHHHFKIWPDLVQRKESKRAEQIWVSDITYLRTKKGFIYLSLVTDAYSRKIVGYNLSRDLKAFSCIKAFKMAFNSRIFPDRSLIHHSDRGIQYCCDEYVKLLKQSNIKISMTQDGNPYDNAIAERVNGILKVEFDLYQTFGNFNEAIIAVDMAIAKYNNIRPHFSCELQTPQQKHNIVLKKELETV